MNMKYDQALGLWLSYNIKSVSELDKYLDNFRILFAYHSGKIENDEITYHDTREIFTNGSVSNYTGNPRALFEQQNQKLCYDFLKEKIVNKEPLSIELVKEIHKILTSGTYDERRYIDNNERPGEFKKHDYITGVREVGSPAADVEADISELIAEMDEYSGNDYLQAAAYFHLKFEYIHPFADGNGRAGRTLFNYYLMINNHPPLIVYEEDKKLYYECLQKYDENEEIKPLCEFFKYETEKTWDKTLSLATGGGDKKKGLSELD